jgi:hypothetical protein
VAGPARQKRHGLVGKWAGPGEGVVLKRPAGLLGWPKTCWAVSWPRGRACSRCGGGRMGSRGGGTARAGCSGRAQLAREGGGAANTDSEVLERRRCRLQRTEQ